MAGAGGWGDDRTAQAYGEFCRKHTMYADTSKDLVRLAEIGDDQTVVDLACGTGQTTEIVLAELSGDGVVHSVDSSPAPERVAIVTDRRSGEMVARVRDRRDLYAGGWDASGGNSVDTLLQDHQDLNADEFA